MNRHGDCGGVSLIGLVGMGFFKNGQLRGDGPNELVNQFVDSLIALLLQQSCGNDDHDCEKGNQRENRRVGQG